jgi:hypothetical protein
MGGQLWWKFLVALEDGNGSRGLRLLKKKKAGIIRFLSQEEVKLFSVSRFVKLLSTQDKSQRTPQTQKTS